MHRGPLTAALVSLSLFLAFGDAPSYAEAGLHARRAAATKSVKGVKRDRRGRIKRSPRAKRDFQKEHPCPATGKTSGRCPGYVIDHVEPLACGGPDDPSNMQWQTVADAKAKDKVERQNCGAR